MRQPLGVVMAWPAAHVELLQAFMAKEPPAEERCEVMLAQLSALAFNRTRGKGESAMSAADFLMDDPWVVKPSLTPDEDRMRAVLRRAAKE